MNTLELAAELAQCLRLAQRAPATAAANTQHFHLITASLPEELGTLLQGAVDMKWPFVEEKWQYKHSVTLEDKVNTADLISQHLPQLLAFLKASIQVSEPSWAMSVIFLVDRFLYWVDGSHTLLKIAKALHKGYPETPVAPQIVLRQARVYLNTGKLQKAEYILSSLISNCGATGCWKYHRDSDRILVQAVSVQVRGQVLQKLGLWLEAMELIWASLVGFYVLPLPDKKGIGTSLGLLANILVSMSDQDFDTFRKKPYINLGFLGDCSHRLLCAAQAAKLAAVFSQFSSLYVLTHMVTWGTCLLSYSFSEDCPPAKKQTYIALAKEVFENGLLTKSETDVVTSQQELHTFLKAAYCLAITNKWLFGPSKEVTMALEACQEATAFLYSYCFKEDASKDVLCSKVMTKVHCVRSLLKVKALANSDPQSFIPDSYRPMEDKPIPFSLSDFTILMESFQKHHKSVCEAFKTLTMKGKRDGQCTHDHCITAFQTQTESLATEGATRGIKPDEPRPLRTDSANNSKHIWGSNKPQASSDAQKDTIGSTLDSEEQHPGSGSDGMAKNVKYGAGGSGSSQGSSNLGSSWLDVPDNRDSMVMVDPSCCTETDDEASVNGGHDRPNGNNGIKGNNTNTNTNTAKANAISSSLQNNLAPASQASQPGATVIVTNTQNQPKPGLCTTLETEEDLQNGNEMEASGRAVERPHGEQRKSSSGTLSSSLGSSWQSVSFSRSPQNRDLAEILEDKQNVDQNCEMVETQDGPDSPFEYINLQPTPPPIGNRGLGSSHQTGSDVNKMQNACSPQTCANNQSAIETVEDLDESGLSGQLSGFSLVDKCSDGAESGNFPPQEPLCEAQPGSNHLNPTLPSTESFELLTEPEPAQSATAPPTSAKPVQNGDINERSQCISEALVTCTKRCFQGCTLGSVVLTEQDYRSFLSGVCQGCLLRRLPNKAFKLGQYNKAYGALVLKYSKATDTWTGCETSVFVGDLLNVAVKGGQRQAFRVQYLHQEQMLGSYVGKEYLRERPIRVHLEDVERQTTAQYYVMEFNKRLYASDITTQIFYIPSEILLITEADAIVACVSVEPFMLGDFVKLTNNTTKIDRRYSATEYGIAFGHFTYEFSDRKEIVVDLQGWVTANGKGLAYLTDPQIHSLIKPRSSSNFHQSGIVKFLQQQHGDVCSSVCLTALHRLRHDRDTSVKQ